MNLTGLCDIHHAEFEFHYEDRSYRCPICEEVIKQALRDERLRVLEWRKAEEFMGE